MKVEVVVKSGSTVSKFVCDFLASDLIADVKGKIASSRAITCALSELVMKNSWDELLEDECTLEECNVDDGQTVVLIVTACEDAIALQIAELLKNRPLTVDEIGLLYCYKFGASVAQALKNVGSELNLESFLYDRSEFEVLEGRVSVVQPVADAATKDDTQAVGPASCAPDQAELPTHGLKPFACADALVSILETNGGTMSVTDLCSKFVHQFHVSLSSIVNARPSEFLLKDPRFELFGRGMVGLRKYPDENGSEAMSKADRFKRAFGGCGQGKRERRKKSGMVKDGLVACVADGKVDGASGDEVVDPEEALYEELHSRVASRSYMSRVSNVLNCVVDQLVDRCFLNVEKVIKGGSVGNGTLVEGSADASIVLFVNGVPTDNHATWMDPMMRSMKTVLECNPSDHIEKVWAVGHTLDMLCSGGLRVSLTVSRPYESHTLAVQALGNQGPDARKYFASTLMKESVAFVQKQPAEVKVTIRLLKWWRDQQVWECEFTRPGNRLLELLAIYAHKAQRPRGQKQAIANCMAILAQFYDARITWTTHYQRSDIWAPLLLQRPLLMDPVNPFVNVVDPQVFDPREVVQKAAVTTFFY